MKHDRNIISMESTLRQALEKLNRLSGSEMTLFVVDNEETLTVVGTLTDGDVRRALLGGATLDDATSKAMYPNFKRLVEGRADNVDEIRYIRGEGITMVPVVDASGRLKEIVDLRARPTILPMRAVLMAGGKGERLRPRTLTTPKPLLKVDGKAIIDYNVEALTRVGITDIAVCTGYMGEHIREHFENPINGVKVKCVQEDAPLGTIGAVTMLEQKTEGLTLVMNSDLLTTVSFEDMYLRHRDSGADITVGVIPYQVSVPFAVLTTNGDSVTGIEEKPSYSHYANGGIYIFNNAILSDLQLGRRTDAPDVIRDAINAGRRVTYYVITGTWIDVGSPTDFRQAEELMRHHRSMNGFREP